MQVFSQEWFQRHQNKILTLLNLPVIGNEFKDILAIRKCDVGWDRPIVEIGPHYYVVANEDGTLTADFRTHEKYGKRLFYQLYPLWRAMHEWDRFVAEPLSPALDFGFATLTAYPEPEPGTTSVDGVVGRVVASETFSTIRGGAGTNASVANANDSIGYLFSSSTTDQYQYLFRGILLFNTTAIGHGYVTAASFTPYITAKTNGLGSADLHVCASTPASNTTLATSDYGNVGSTSFGSVTYAGATTSAYNAITLDANGIAAVNPSGVSKFSTRLSWDQANSFTGTWVSTVTSSFSADMADQTGSTTDPKLDVTYTPHSTIANRNKLKPRLFAPGNAR